MKQSKLKSILKWAAVALLWLTAWQLAAAAVDKEILIPYPRAGFFKSYKPLQNLGILGCRGAFAASHNGRLSFGYCGRRTGAVLSSRFKVFKVVFSPVLHIVRAVPVASFIILALVWIKSAYLAVFISFLTVTPMIWSSTESGIENIDVKYLEAAKIFRLNPFKTLFEVKLPFLLPSFTASAANALGFAWKSGVAAEVICRPAGSIGRLLQDAKLYLETPNVFAVTAVVALLSLAFEIIIKRIAKRFMYDSNK